MFKVSPKQIWCAILTYEKHAAEYRGQKAVRPTKIPQFILKSPSAIVYDNEPVILPDLKGIIESEDPWGWITGEVELAAIIKKKTYKVPPEKIGDYILGYTILNDVTQRDLQQKMGFPHSMAKSFPSFSPVGPRLATPEEIPDPNNLHLTFRLNGNVVQSSNTSQMTYTVEEIVSWASRLFVLYKGDIVSTGTPEGCLSYKLKPGDLMEAEVEKIGVLKNPVALAVKKK
jgi:2-keto-4-pentenoate hydratase/2-oxohepta-3-ene-1,7-dioic acid hydratase in catechol pathway